MTEKSPAGNLCWIWRAVIFCFGLAAGWCIYHFEIVPSAPFHWDEAAHSLKGVLIAHDARTGDWLSFLYDSYRQVYWPFLGSWLLGAAFLLHEPTMTSARTVTLILFLISGFFVYASGLQLRQRYREISATIATVLFLTSPLLLKLSGQAMLEIPAVCFVCLTILTYLWSEQPGRSGARQVWLALAMLCTYFTRTNYGILIMLVWAATVISDGGFKTFVSRKSLLTILPIFLCLTIWFAYPPKIATTWSALVNIPWGMSDPYSVRGFLYYPNILLHCFGSFWQSLVPVIALMIAFRYWRHPGVRFVIFLVLIQLAFGLAHHQRLERHMAPIVPALCVITGFVVAEYWSFTPGWPRLVPRILAVAVCVAGAMRLPAVLHPLGLASSSEVVDAVVAGAAGAKASLVLSTREIRNPSPPLLDWQLTVEKRQMGINQSGVAMNFQEDQKIHSRLERMSLPGWIRTGLLRLTSRGTEPSRIQSWYVGLTTKVTTPADAAEVSRFLQELDRTRHFDQFLVLTSAAPEDLYSSQWVETRIRSLGFQPDAVQPLTGGNIQFQVYRRLEQREQ